jgi:hypothetical protein
MQYSQITNYPTLDYENKIFEKVFAASLNRPSRFRSLIKPLKTLPRSYRNH